MADHSIVFGRQVSEDNQEVRRSMASEPYLGASSEAITAAAGRLGLVFPAELAAIWVISNGLELPGGWRVFPVFDAREPRKTCNDIVYENTKGRWDRMADDLIAIAAGDTGNCLVLRRTGESLHQQIELWDHETNRTRKWSKDLKYILSRAEARVAKIRTQIARGVGRRSRSDGGGRLPGGD